MVINMYYLQITTVALDSYLWQQYSCLIDVIVSSIQKSCKRKLSSFTTKNMINICKGCDVHKFFVEEIIEAVSSIAKMWPKNKD